MRYISTRGRAPTLSFANVVATGLASDGGLYVPESWPQIGLDELQALQGRTYAEVALAVLSQFIDESVPPSALAACIDEAYRDFGHELVAPLVQYGPDQWLLELWHGPTLAFKDVAMRLLARLMEAILRDRGGHATIVGATSGDTGSAAIDAFRGLAAADVFILYPHGRVSDVQRRQMTTVPDANVHTVAVDGTFDDCQALVKAMFADAAFNQRMHLSGVNSINWARIMAQTVYYFTAALALGAPERRISFAVPTGNFGDIFAGYVAKCMGLPVGDLVIATNVNDILDRTLKSGRYAMQGVVSTSSPSMDIEISSNFERLLFEAVGRDPEKVRRLMEGLKQSRAFTLEEQALGHVRGVFASARADEAETRGMIASIFARTGLLVDPHTAVGLVAAATVQRRHPGPMVVLSTAHPAKFPEAVAAATGVKPRLPARLADLLDRPERINRLPNDLTAVEDFIARHARAQRMPQGNT
ncbi:threonine synthase [Rhodoligotrophos defluvii]|uniref:threonine synthase n=1 Tax=Rhodoligotrophos defluvii TaxID=2561934 RepID=UPI0010C94C5F|nr:threonine synthase [Rhodoligotrophos defluvii]